MKNNKQEVETYRKILKQILFGKSLRSVEKEFGIDRENILKDFRTIFAESPRELELFEKVVKRNSKTCVEINNKKLSNTVSKIIGGEITLNHASEELNIDTATLRKNMINFVNNSDNKELKKKYIEYYSNLHPDYSYINFKALCIKMMQEGVSQTQIASEYGVPARTVSREFAKMKNEEEYKDLYDIVKIYSEYKMKRKPFSIMETILLEKVLLQYKDEGDVIIENAVDKREKRYYDYLEKLENAEKTDGKIDEKAKSVGVSSSTYRRMKKYVEQYEIDQKIENEMKEEEK